MLLTKSIKLGTLISVQSGCCSGAALAAPSTVVLGPGNLRGAVPGLGCTWAGLYPCGAVPGLGWYLRGAVCTWPHTGLLGHAEPVSEAAGLCLLLMALQAATALTT